MRWERKAVQEDMHLCVLTLDRTFFYVYQPKYITDHAFKYYQRLLRRPGTKAHFVFPSQVPKESNLLPLPVWL